MIITESNFTNIITESSEDKKSIFLKGVFMESEEKNRNGRIYKKPEIEAAVKKINEEAQNGRPILGELDHPPTLEVKLENVSHRIIAMEMQGNNAVGKAEIITTVPKGQIAKGLIEAGVKIGVSSRGRGTVNKTDGVVEGFELITIDLVANPSAITAYPESVMEHLQMYRGGHIITDLAEAVIHDTKAQKYFKDELMKFIKENFN